MKRAFVVGVGLFVVAVNLACGEAQKALPPMVTAVGTDSQPAPAITVENLEVDDSCSKLLDYCVHVSCDAVSVARENETAQVELWVAQKGKDELVHHESVTLAAGGRQSLQSDFPEASLFGNTPTGGCRVVRSAIDVVCSLKNDGGPGDVLVNATVEDQDFQNHSGSKRVKIAAGASKVAVVRVPVAGVKGDAKWKFSCDVK